MPSPDRQRSRREAFIGVRPGMVALDLSAGVGYMTELIARAVGPSGKVYGQSPPRDPNRAPPAAPEGVAAPAEPAPAGPPNSAAALVERAKNTAVSHIVPVVRKFEDPIPPEVAANALDLVTLMFNYHDLGHLGVERTPIKRAMFAALKPGGCT